MKNKRAFILLSITLVLLGGCIATPPTLVPTEMPAPTIRPMPTATSAPEVAATIAPEPMAALPADEALARLQAYLRNDEGCRLPCWMDITPGESPWPDVQAQLALFDNIAPQTSFGEVGEEFLGWLYIVLPDGDLNVVLNTGYFARLGEDTVNLVDVNTSLEREDGSLAWDEESQAYRDLLEAYSLPEVLAAYGLPDQVYVISYVLTIGLGDVPLPGDTFAIRLFYPQAGLFFRYQMPVEKSGDDFVICPANALVSFDALSPAYAADYQAILQTVLPASSYEGLFPTSIHYKMPEEAFGMTIEEFAGQVQSSPEDCLRTPISVWPAW